MQDVISYGNYILQQTDIDECELKELNDCQQHCTNTVGSFTCSCQEGFTLNADGRNCDGISLCSVLSILAI